MVDQEAVDAQYASMIASLTESSDMDSESALIRSSVLNGKVSIETLNIMDTDELEIGLNIDAQNMLRSTCLSDNTSSPKNEPKTSENFYKQEASYNGSKRTHVSLNQDILNNRNLYSQALNSPELTNIINMIVNSLPPLSTNNTAVEQPNIGPCSCFICGKLLVDPGKRFSYFKSQKLFSMQMTLLQLLSDVVNQTVVTNTDCIDLCQQCSETMNEVDITYKHLNDLKQEIVRLFNINNRPKLTCHVLHDRKIADSKTLNVPMKYDTQFNSSSINLDDLVSTRRKRGRVSKKYLKTKSSSASQTHSKDNSVKKKGGRPRKPFQCNICKRKFLTEGMINSHMKKEHYYDDKAKIKKPFSSNSISKDEEDIIMEALNKVKTESVEENAENVMQDGGSLVAEFKPKAISNKDFLRHLIMPPISKTSLTTILQKTHSKGLTKFNSTMRPIQPKPQTLVQTTYDGSMLFYMNPTYSESSPTLIKISRDYLNLQSESHECAICSKSFLDDKSLKVHKAAIHGGKKKKINAIDFNCKVGKSEIFSKDLIDSNKGWECSRCEVVFSTKMLLMNHKRKVHSHLGSFSRDHRKEKLYSCEKCDQAFIYKYEYETHKETHLPFNQVGPHEFLCCICGLKFASKASLKLHLHRFHDKPQHTKEYLCAECGYMTSTKKTFTEHVRLHNEAPEPKTQCYVCKKEMLYSSFKIHMLRMHGEAKYSCETCDQKFTIRSDLMKHINTVHSSLKPYDCGICDKKFVTSEALRYHKNKMHTMSVSYHYCGICEKCYKSKWELKKHITRCHNIAKISFSDSKKLRNHESAVHKDKSNVTFINSSRICKLEDSNEAEEIISVPIHNIDLSSSAYETHTSNQSKLNSAHIVVTSSQSITSQEKIQVMDPLIQAYQSPSEESITLTTLHNHIPSQHTDGTYSHLEDHTQYHQSQPQQSISLVDAHNQQMLNSHSSQVQDHSTLTQYSDALSNIQSIYIVPESVCL